MKEFILPIAMQYLVKKKKNNLWWKPKIIIHFAGLLSGGQTTSVAL